MMKKISHHKKIGFEIFHVNYLNSNCYRSDHGILKNKFTSYLQNIHLLRDGVSVFLHFLNLVNHYPDQFDPDNTGKLYT